MKIAWVKWFDANYMEGPEYANSIDPGITLHSAGILIEADKSHVTLVGDYWDAYPSARSRHIHSIPKVNITEMRVIEVDDMKKRRLG